MTSSRLDWYLPPYFRCLTSVMMFLFSHNHLLLQWNGAARNNNIGFYLSRFILFSIFFFHLPRLLPSARNIFYLSPFILFFLSLDELSFLRSYSSFLISFLFAVIIILFNCWKSSLKLKSK